MCILQTQVAAVYSTTPVCLRLLVMECAQALTTFLSLSPPTHAISGLWFSGIHLCTTKLYVQFWTAANNWYYAHCKFESASETTSDVMLKIEKKNKRLHEFTFQKHKLLRSLPMQTIKPYPKHKVSQNNLRPLTCGTNQYQVFLFMSACPSS